MSLPRFSIVLPSTDRPALLPAAVRSVLASSDPDFEVVVSDNCSRQSAREILEPVADPRLRVLRAERRLPVSDHWEFFWPHLRGEFVIILGDDNALHPRAIELADRAIGEHRLELLVWRAAAYFYPDWDLDYPGLPNRGNLLSFEPGTTDRWYRCDPAAVMRHFCRELRFSACFPNMLTCVFPRRYGDELRRRAGRFFWPPNPDVAASLFVMGLLAGSREDAGPAPFGFYDGFLAVGGRSVDSNVTSWLSRGVRSRRIFEYVADHAGSDFMPHHTPRFVTMTNTLAASITVARTCFGGEFAAYRYDDRTLALRVIDDMYVLAQVPWVNDPAFLAEVEAFFEAVPPAFRAEVFARFYRCRREFMEREAAPPAVMRPAAEGITWEADGNRYVDMATHGTSDIAGAAAHLPETLGRYNHRATALVDHYRGLGLLGKALPD